MNGGFRTRQPLRENKGMGCIVCQRASCPASAPEWGLFFLVFAPGNRIFQAEGSGAANVSARKRGNE